MVNQTGPKKASSDKNAAEVAEQTGIYSLNTWPDDTSHTEPAGTRRLRVHITKTLSKLVSSPVGLIRRPRSWPATALRFGKRSTSRVALNIRSWVRSDRVAVRRYYVAAFWYSVVLIESTAAWRYISGLLVLHQGPRAVPAEFLVPLGAGVAATLYLMLVPGNKRVGPMVIVPSVVLSGSSFASLANPDALDRFASFATQWFSVAVYLAVGFAHFFTSLRDSVFTVLSRRNQPLKQAVVNTLIDECKFWIERSIFVAAAFMGALGVVALLIWNSPSIMDMEKFVYLVSAALGFGFGVLAIAIWAGGPLVETIGALRASMLSDTRLPARREGDK